MLIPRLAELYAALPNIDLRTMATEALSDFDRDQVDIAVRLTRPPFPTNLEAQLLFRQDLVAVASPRLVKGLTLPLTGEELRKLPLLHDSHDHWRVLLQSREKLPGAAFNHTTLALDAALAGQRRARLPGFRHGRSRSRPASAGDRGDGDHRTRLLPRPQTFIIAA